MRCPGITVHCPGCGDGSGGELLGMLAGVVVIGALAYAAVEWVLANLLWVLLTAGGVVAAPVGLLVFYRLHVMPRQKARYELRYRAQGAAVRAPAARRTIDAPVRVVRLGAGAVREIAPAPPQHAPVAGRSRERAL